MKQIIIDRRIAVGIVLCMLAPYVVILTDYVMFEFFGGVMTFPAYLPLGPHALNFQTLVGAAILLIGIIIMITYIIKPEPKSLGLVPLEFCDQCGAKLYE